VFIWSLGACLGMEWVDFRVLVNVKVENEGMYLYLGFMISVRKVLVSWVRRHCFLKTYSMYICFVLHVLRAVFPATF
jgi:hypothetical protein